MQLEKSNSLWNDAFHRLSPFYTLSSRIDPTQRALHHLQDQGWIVGAQLPGHAH